jgi:hypothetical protein
MRWKKDGNENPWVVIMDATIMGHTIEEVDAVPNRIS